MEIKYLGYKLLKYYTVEVNIFVTYWQTVGCSDPIEVLKMFLFYVMLFSYTFIRILVFVF